MNIEDFFIEEYTKTKSELEKARERIMELERKPEKYGFTIETTDIDIVRVEAVSYYSLFDYGRFNHFDADELRKIIETPGFDYTGNGFVEIERLKAIARVEYRSPDKNWVKHIVSGDTSSLHDVLSVEDYATNPEVQWDDMLKEYCTAGCESDLVKAASNVAIVNIRRRIEKLEAM